MTHRQALGMARALMAGAVLSGIGAGIGAEMLATPAMARPRGGFPGFAFAEPSDIVDAEVALSRRAAAKGGAEAMRATAGPQAEIIVAGSAPMRAADTLRSRAAAAPDAFRSTYAVWMSCDSSFAVSYGSWQHAQATGWYVTVWSHQPKGGYKWVLDRQGAFPAGTASTPPDMIRAQAGDCPARHGEAPPAPAAKPDAPEDVLSGEAKDRTLIWTSSGGGFSVQLRRNGALREVLSIADGAVHVLP